MKTIEVTDETYAQLMKISAELNTQSHRATAMPYMFQIEQDIEIPAHNGCGDEIWVNPDGDTLRDDEQIRDYLVEKWSDEFYAKQESLRSVECVHMANNKYDKLEKENFDFNQILESDEFYTVHVTNEKKYTNFFFTESACKAHIRQNNYHYSNPKDFLSHGFRNPELEAVMKFLCELTPNGEIHK